MKKTVIVGLMLAGVTLSGVSLVVGHAAGLKTGYEQGRYAMREHIDDVRWVKMCSGWVASYDIAMASDAAKKGSKYTGDIASDQFCTTFKKMAKANEGTDPTEESWLKANGFKD